MPMATAEEQREYQRLWLQARRTQWLKEHGPCALCGSWEKLEVDHEDPTKKITHRVWSWCKEKRDVELAKCRPICEKCHAVKTGNENKERFQILDPSRWKHGTNNTYNKHGCRCEQCRKWRAEKHIRLGT